MSWYLEQERQFFMILTEDIMVVMNLERNTMISLKAIEKIVGWINEHTPIMPVANNNKINDKKFVATFGETTTFTYGCKRGQSDIYVYRITKTDEDGNVYEYPTWMAQNYCEKIGVKHVPILSQFVIDEGTDLIEIVKIYKDGHNLIDPTHIL